MYFPPADPVDARDKVSGCLGSHQFQDTTITVTRGDYSPLMKRMADNLEKAKVISYLPRALLMELFVLLALG